MDPVVHILCSNELHTGLLILLNQSVDRCMEHELFLYDMSYQTFIYYPSGNQPGRNGCLKDSRLSWQAIFFFPGNQPRANDLLNIQCTRNVSQYLSNVLANLSALICIDSLGIDDLLFAG